MFAYAIFGTIIICLVAGTAYVSIILQNNIGGIMSIGGVPALGSQTALVTASITINHLNLGPNQTMEFSIDFIMRRFTITPSWHVSSSDKNIEVLVNETTQKIIIKNVGYENIDCLTLNIGLEVKELNASS